MCPWLLFPPGFFRRLALAFATVALVFPALSATAPKADNLITNDVFFKDTDGNPIWSQGGGIFKFGDTYYWYGVKYDGAVTYFNNPAAGMVRTTVFNAITCYSSKDLVHWHFENNVLTTQTPGLGRTGWVGRMGVAYNKNTKKYVLISQGGGGELFATCDTPTGDFAFDHVQRGVPNVVNNTTGDQTIFQDDDGKAYVICCNSSGRSHLYVCPLRDSDFLEVEPAVEIHSGGGREGNCMFKYNGRYYFCSSDLHGWNASHSYVIDAANILGPYSEESVLDGTDADFSHVTQTGFFVTVHGSAATTVLFCGDRWSDFAGNGLGYNEWCPLSFNGAKPHFNSVSQFRLDAATGEWSVGPANNYVLNPSFEADRVAQNHLAGWTFASSPAANANHNALDAHTGRWSLIQYAETDYDATSSQTITGLPAGAYTLKVWVKSSGGQSAAEIFAKDFGDDELKAAITKRLDAWTEITLPGIKVSNGQCTLGSHSHAAAKDWLEADDFSLTKD